MGSYPLLESIGDPRDLRGLDRSQLAQLATELRAFIVDSVAATGGHLSSNLGTVELTIALHYVFKTPEDRLIWDVGHQTYGHKILTGRREGMKRLRQKGGIAGFPRREESAYDTFGTAHSSTSISAALGMAVAAKRQGADRHVVAVIGDGAMTAGMAFEALNNAEQTGAQRDRDPERQRHVDLGERRRAQQLPRQAHVGPLLRRDQEDRREGARRSRPR